MTVSISGSQITYNDNTTQNTSPFTGGLGFRNRIINGACMIDQRNAGASVTILTTTGYTLDRWQSQADQNSKYSIQQSSVAPTGFNNSLLVTSLSAYTVGASETFQIRQRIEGSNIVDLSWGTSSAATITLSFWVRSSLTGTFGGAIYNSAANRSYTFSYTISSANTWEQKSITIVGDTTGTWLTTNGIGMTVTWGLGTGSSVSGTAGSWSSTVYSNVTGATSIVGTNGATFYITGVQLEKGSTATSFDYRPYGTELALCQRYYQKSMPQGTVPGASPAGLKNCNVIDISSLNRLFISGNTLLVTMRTTPTFTYYSEDGTANSVSVYSNTASKLTISSVAGQSDSCLGSFIQTSTSGVASQCYIFLYTASAEL